MFEPPPEHLRPAEIAVPTRIKNQCITDAAKFFGINTEYVFTLFDGEGGKVGTFSKNKNGTYDIGPMQINSSNLQEIRNNFPTVTWKVLAYDACASFWVGTWWLHNKIKDRNGNVFEGIADYNSKTPEIRAIYIFNFMKKLNRRLQDQGTTSELTSWSSYYDYPPSFQTAGK